jgi:hypothetical protein
VKIVLIQSSPKQKHRSYNVLFFAVLLRINCNDYSCVEGVWLFLNVKFKFLMLVALAISHLLMPAALTLPDYHYLCLWLVGNFNKNNKNRINLSFGLVLVFQHLRLISMERNQP